MRNTLAIFVYKTVRYGSRISKGDILIDVISFNMRYYLTIDISNEKKLLHMELLHCSDFCFSL